MELEKAAKKRRIEVHPDKLAKLTGLGKEERARKETEAKEVGWAADTLLDPKARKKYDTQLSAWQRKKA